MSIGISVALGAEVERLRAELATKSKRVTDLGLAVVSLRAELAASKRAIEALVEFASTVAPGSSWWDDTWPEHEAAMAGGG